MDRRKRKTSRKTDFAARWRLFRAAALGSCALATGCLLEVPAAGPSIPAGGNPTECRTADGWDLEAPARTEGAETEPETESPKPSSFRLDPNSVGGSPFGWILTFSDEVELGDGLISFLAREKDGSWRYASFEGEEGEKYAFSEESVEGKTAYLKVGNGETGEFLVIGPSGEADLSGLASVEADWDGRGEERADLVGEAGGAVLDDFDASAFE